MTLRGAAAALLLAAGALAAPAAATVPVPPLSGHVVDQTGTLSVEQKAVLEQDLAAFESAKGSQLAVLMVATTAPEAIEQYSLRVAEKWKLGRKRVDDGAILVIAKDDRALRIEVGYGLEGALTDLTSKRIIDETIVPRLRRQDYFGGILAGIGRIIDVVNGEPLPPPQADATAGRGGFGPFVPVLVILALGIGGALRAALGKLPGALLTGGIVTAIAWMLAGTLGLALLAGTIALVFTLVGGGMVGRSIGGFYGGMGGGGGFGGGGGGGFSGGGGSFGGGGASGRW